MGLAPLVAANAQRHATATATSVATVRAALERLDAAPVRLVAAGNLRLAHPDATLAELGALATPPVSKDTITSLLRRLVQLAERTH